MASGANSPANGTPRPRTRNRSLPDRHQLRQCTDVADPRTDGICPLREGRLPQRANAKPSKRFSDFRKAPQRQNSYKKSGPKHMFDPESFAQMDMYTPLHNLFLLAGRLSLRFDLLEKLFQRDSVIIAQVRQSRQRECCGARSQCARYSRSVSKRTFSWVKPRSRRIDFQPLNYLLHQNVITPLSFHTTKKRISTLKSYYTLVIRAGNHTRPSPSGRLRFPKQYSPPLGKKRAFSER